MEAREKEGHPWRLYHNCPFGIFGGEIKIFSEKRTIVLMDALSMIAPITHIQGSAASISRPRTNTYDQLFLASSFQASHSVHPFVWCFHQKVPPWFDRRRGPGIRSIFRSEHIQQSFTDLDSDSFHAVSCSACVTWWIGRDSIAYLASKSK